MDPHVNLTRIPARRRAHRRHALALAVLAGGCLMPAVQAAELGRTDIGGPGAMISSCSGMNFSGSAYNIGDKGWWLAGQVDCHAEQTTLPGVTMAQGSAYAVAGQVNASSHGVAQMGKMGLYATFFADNSYGFAQAESTAGWVDLITLIPVNPADLGSTAVLTFGLHVEGIVQGLPMGNSGVGIGVRPYVDDAPLPVQPEFSVNGQGQFGFPFDAVVDTIALFSVEVTLGTEFELGVFSRAVAGIAGAGGVPGTIFSSATADFANTITWAGISSLTVNGVPVGYQANSASGIDWTRPFGTPSDSTVPESGSLMLTAAGLAVLAFRRRRGARSLAC